MSDTPYTPLGVARQILDDLEPLEHTDCASMTGRTHELLEAIAYALVGIAEELEQERDD